MSRPSSPSNDPANRQASQNARPDDQSRPLLRLVTDDAEDIEPEPDTEVSIYTQGFFIAFAANIALVIGNTMSFRFAELVKFLGGSEEITGRIVSFGLIISLVVRSFAGQAMDRFGIRRIWALSALLFLVGATWIMLSSNLEWPIYAARAVFIGGLSTMFACSVSHIQRQVPANRRTEIIGTFGASGFVGMILGAQLVDLFFWYFPDGALRYQAIFGWIFLMGLINLSLAMWLTNGERPVAPDTSISLRSLLSRHFPISILLVTLMMGLGFSVTTVFLTRYATSLGLSGTRTFFTAYAITAFSMRFVARRWSNTMGRHRMIWWGMLGHVAGHALLLTVSRDWHLIVPAACCGFGHALLFPCVVSLGAGPFPLEHRATGTTITLASIDLGTVLTAPFMGYLIDHYGFRTTFIASASTFFSFAVLYAIWKYREIDEEVVLPN